MEDRPLKQRLIGAIVLVALAVIFIPILLSGRPEGDLGGSNIPPQPAEQKQVKVLRLDGLPAAPTQSSSESGSGHVLVDKDLPARPAASSPAKPAPVGDKPAGQTAPASAGSGDKPPSTAPETPPATAPATPLASAAPAAAKAWAVQVGSFTREANALALRDRLRAKHFPAFVDAIAGSKGTVYRVRVGPEVSRSGAEALQKRLSKVIKTKTLVVTHP